MRVLALDVSLDDSRVDHGSFSSTHSIFEYDAIIWDPVGTIVGYLSEEVEYYENLPSLDHYESARLKADIKRRHAEFKEFIEMGRTLVIFAAPPLEVYVDTGKRETSGTGKNQAVTHLVSKLDLLVAIPFSIKSTSADGKRIAAKDESFAALIREGRELWSYRTIFEEYPGSPLAVVSGTNKVVGSIFIAESGGRFIQLPKIENLAAIGKIDLDEIVTDIDRQESAKNKVDGLVSALIDWIGNIGGRDLEKLPEWASELVFKEDLSRIAELWMLNKKMREIEAKISNIENVRAKDNDWKKLITATGHALEEKVEQAFELLGFEILEKADRRSDLRMKYGDNYSVVEIKGVKKSASEANAAQLEKWVSEARLEYEVAHKGILVVNTWRDKDISDRNENDFPAQMIPYCIARDHCLISGLQLLAIVRAKINDVAPGDIVEQILSHSGVFSGWSDFNEIFSPNPSVEAVATPIRDDNGEDQLAAVEAE
jgi:hypothetical protein